MHSSPGILELVLCFIAYILLGLAPLAGVTYLIYFLVTLPMRRQERARGFIDLLELGLKEGRTPEAAITQAASSRDAALGARFHLLAAYLEQGARLDEALNLAPRLLPPQIVAMIRAGSRIGDLSKVLPACRLLLRDSVSQVRGALNYLLLAAFVVTPFSIGVPLYLQIKVLPSFRSVFGAMTGDAPPPALTRFVLDSSWLFTGAQVGFFALLWLAALAYLGGPRLRCLADRWFPGAADRCLYLFPWRRKRLQRDFSAMLAVLLDAGVPEPQALRLAGESTANALVVRRAAAAARRLEQGVTLGEAIQVLDNSAELRWRLGNALRQSGGFARALAGWHDALDARAFQLEQTAAQLSTTALVLINGLIVGTVVAGIFLMLIQLINIAALW